MRDITLDFNGSPLPLRLTAGALFDLYDRFGVHDSILRATGAMEDTPQGWMACCKLAALLADQAELWRRRRGYTPKRRPKPADFAQFSRTQLLGAVRQAVEAGFSRSIPGAKDDEGEVNLILAARNDEAAESAERLRVGFLTVCAVRLNLAPADALLLTPGEYLDMVTLLSGGEEGDYGGPADYN